MKSMRNTKYKSLKHMRADLEQLCSDFGSDNVVGIVCNMKSQYAYLKCVMKECKFEHWFSYT